MEINATNATNVSDDDNYSVCIRNDEVENFAHTAREIWMVTTIMPIMLALCLTTNGAFLYVVVQIKSMYTVTNRYLSSLALADISYILVRYLKYLIPYITVPAFYSEQYIGDAGCVLFPLLLDITFFVSLAMVTIVSLDRYYAVHKPQENRFRYTRKYSRIIIIFSWMLCSVLAGIFQIPSSGKLTTLKFCDDWGNKSDMYPPVYVECTPFSGEFVSIGLVSMTIPFFLSMIINFILYAKIIYLLNRRAGSSEVAKKSNRHTRNRITIMLVTTGILFFLLFAPYEISLLVSQTLFMQGTSELIYASNSWNIWYEMCKILVCVLHIINPIIYNATNRRYREAFARAFGLHDIIYRSPAPASSSYKQPSAIQATYVTAMDPSTQTESLRLHCFDGPSCKSSAEEVETPN